MDSKDSLCNFCKTNIDTAEIIYVRTCTKLNQLDHDGIYLCCDFCQKNIIHILYPRIITLEKLPELRNYIRGVINAT